MAYLKSIFIQNAHFIGNRYICPSVCKTDKLIILMRNLDIGYFHCFEVSWFWKNAIIHNFKSIFIQNAHFFGKIDICPSACKTDKLFILIRNLDIGYFDYFRSVFIQNAHFVGKRNICPSVCKTDKLIILRPNLDIGYFYCFELSRVETF